MSYGAVDSAYGAPDKAYRAKNFVTRAMEIAAEAPDKTPGRPDMSCKPFNSRHLPGSTAASPSGPMLRRSPTVHPPAPLSNSVQLMDRAREHTTESRGPKARRIPAWGNAPCSPPQTSQRQRRGPSAPRRRPHGMADDDGDAMMGRAFSPSHVGGLHTWGRCPRLV